MDILGTRVRKIKLPGISSVGLREPGEAIDDAEFCEPTNRLPACPSGAGGSPLIDIQEFVAGQQDSRVGRPRAQRAILGGPGR